MSESFGSLVDRLTITNIKLWFTQQKIMDWSKVPLAELEKTSYEDLHKVIMDLNHLNLDRNRLMTDLEQCLAEAVRTGRPRVDARVKLT